MHVFNKSIPDGTLWLDGCKWPYMLCPSIREGWTLNLEGCLVFPQLSRKSLQHEEIEIYCTNFENSRI